VSVTIKTNTDAMFQEVKARVRDALRTAGPLILRSAIQKCPVDTGNLQRNIETEYEGLSLRVGTQVEYGGYVEGGTSKMAAQPYLRPALDENLRKIKKIFKAI